jgi:hypothetical protein
MVFEAPETARRLSTKPIESGQLSNIRPQGRALRLAARPLLVLARIQAREITTTKT